MNKRKYNETDIEAALKGAKSFKLSEVEKATLKFNLMDVINSGEARTTRHTSRNHRRFAMPFLPLIIAAIFVSGSATVALADNAKPGDTLFPVDLWAESIQAKFATDNDAKVRLLANTNQERLDEVLALSSETEGDAKLAEHKAAALARLAANAERLEILKLKFEAKAEAAKDEKQKEKFQRIATHIAELQVQMENRLKTLEERFAKIFAEGEIEVKSKRWWDVHPATLKAQLEAEVDHDFKFGEFVSTEASGKTEVEASRKGSFESELKAIFKERLEERRGDDNDRNVEEKDGLRISNDSLIQSGWNKVEEIN